MRNGIRYLDKPSRLLLKITYLDNLFENVCLLLEEKNISAKKEAILSTVLAFCLICSIVVAIIFSSFVAGLAVVVCACVCVVTSIRASLDRRTSSTRNAIPEALRSMSTCFGAGYTLFQTFNQLSKDTKGVLRKLFLKSSHILQTGGSIIESLAPLKESKETPELSFVAVALSVQHQTGGSLRPVIESAKDMIDSKLELLRLLQVQTAQAKLSSRIVTILPFGLIAIFSIISPNFLQPFFSSFFGLVIFVLACIMQAAGVIMVKKTLRVVV